MMVMEKFEKEFQEHFDGCFLYASDLVKENGGYIRPSEIIDSVIYDGLGVTLTEEQKKELNWNEIAPIYEINEDNIDSVYESIKNKKRVFVLGDDATNIFDSYLHKKDIHESIKWVSVLSSAQLEFNKKVRKYWISQNLEISLLVNTLNNNCTDFSIDYNKEYNIETILLSTESVFTNKIVEHFKNVLVKRYDYRFGEKNDNRKNVVFVAGLGDDTHIKEICDIIESGNYKIILTNSAIRNSIGTYREYLNNELENNEIQLSYVDIKETSVNFKHVQLQQLLLSVAIELESRHNLDNYLKSPYLSSRVSFDEDNYLSFPLVVNTNGIEVSLYNDNGYDRVAETIHKIVYEDEILRNKSIKFLNIHCINSNPIVIVYSSDNANFNKVDKSISDIYKSFSKKKGEDYIQINLVEEDPTDNNTQRLVFQTGDSMRYPIKLPIGEGVKVCLAKSMYSTVLDDIIETDINAYEVCGKLREVKETVSTSIKYIYIIPYTRYNKVDELSTWYAVLGVDGRLDYLELGLLKSKILPYFLIEEYRYEAVKSARAAIMSRNMSHNLGSHVMFYIKQKLQSVSKIVNSEVLHNIIPGNINNLEKIQSLIAEKKSIELPFLVGLGRFINYLQERQDYIATVASNYLPAKSTISFKDFIYDELKPDLRYKRHHPNGAVYDAGWQPSNLLLDYIAYSEGYDSSSKIQIWFDGFDGNNSSNEEDFERLRKFNISIPGGVIGRQAIFSIMENIIRNAAKHSVRSVDNKMPIVFSLLDNDEKLSRLIANGHTLKAKREEGGEIEEGEVLVEKYQRVASDYHILEIRLNMLNKADDINTLIDKLSESYINREGVIKDSSKGLKEMRISAAWLRGELIDTEINESLPPVLSIHTIPSKDNYVKFSYIICLPKAKKVAFVLGGDDYKNNQDLNDILKGYGCMVCKNCEELDVNGYELICLGTTNEELSIKHHSHVLTNSNATLEIMQQIKEQINDSKDKIESIIESTIGKVYDCWFEEWFKKRYADKSKPKLVICDEKAYHAKKDKQEEIKDLIDNGLKLTTTGLVESSDCENSVIYSTHYNGMSYLSEDVAIKYGMALSVESITGNNSTDRLIRKDVWNKEWFNKHLYAGVVNVAILDERIYSTFISTNRKDEPKDFIADCDTLRLEFKQAKHENINILEVVNKFRSKYTFVSLKDVKMLGNSSEEEAERYIRSIKTYDSSLAQINKDRRIWAFDVMIDADSVYFKGLKMIPNVATGNISAILNQEPDLIFAKIERRANAYEVISLVENCTYANMFDIMSVHQGILDKIYTAFGIKDNNAEKLKISLAIHNYFSYCPVKREMHLPNFIIHSGRSKPSKRDMPQEQPFVQFAAIDHAVKDSKYTLVNLLTTAYYESGDNN